MMDRNLFPFATLKATGVPEAGGDIAFDDDEGCAPPAAANAAVIKLQRSEGD
jgi:tRNA 2-thiocytidine biosynthesis protein TtcA